MRCGNARHWAGRRRAGVGGGGRRSRRPGVRTWSARSTRVGGGGGPAVDRLEETEAVVSVRASSAASLPRGRPQNTLNSFAIVRGARTSSAAHVPSTWPCARRVAGVCSPPGPLLPHPMDVSALRAEIKSWEKLFRQQHGRDPSIQEIKDLPDIGQSVPRRTCCTPLTTPRPQRTNTSSTRSSPSSLHMRIGAARRHETPRARPRPPSCPPPGLNLVPSRQSRPRPRPTPSRPSRTNMASTADRHPTPMLFP